MPRSQLVDYVVQVNDLDTFTYSKSFELNRKILSIDFPIPGDSTKNENSYASCSGLKKAGHFKSEIYNLKNPEDKWSRIAFCDMQNSDGYDDNSIESLLGYLNTSPEPAQIMFSVYSNSGNIEGGHYIDFDYTWINNGNHFSLSDGEFTAPIHGNYEFSFSGHHNPNAHHTKILVLKNGNVVQGFQAYDHSYVINLSSIWITELKAGDKIRLSVFAGSLYCSSNAYRTFSGKLLEIM